MKEILHKSKEKIESKIKEYLAIPVPVQIPQKPIKKIIIIDSTLSPNASAQKKALEIINSTNIKLVELQQIYNSTNNLEIWNNLSDHIETLKQTLHNENNKIKRLKYQTEYQQRNRVKKTKLLHEHQEIIKYDSPDHLPLLIQYSDLHKHIHECIKFGTADKKRKKEIIKDDKAKVPLGISTVGKTFQTLQSFQEPVTLLDHDFPIISTSSSTHMSNLNSLIQDNRFDGILKINGQIKPIWILLVDGGPDENLHHIKNIF
ncbi:hypothetical protein GLOIN_2v1766467 [Rhizophagus clarus]|uniref:Uncharacterized protein n=1 Tax=Rhizophagus clarus TaxID=94130 RepID=A0A8H3MCX2_9GLOM|nr:hypothetical protein GLOIN_2v1766467 [Rhizophagus clarus]